MLQLPYLRWSPESSAVRIEIRADLLRELRPRPDGVETSGKLYGVRSGREIRITAAQETEGQECVGIFVSRIRGDVFLTEADLHAFESQKASVALVIAGPRAGFFTHEPDGAIQAVRSHEEFPLDDLPPVPRPTPVPQPRLPGVWRRPTRAAAAMAAIALPVAALAYLRTSPPPRPLGLELSDRAGQLRISWIPGILGVLEIEEGGERLSVPVYQNQSNATYLRDGKEVEISLTPLDPSGRLHPESARFVESPPAAATPAR